MKNTKRILAILGVVLLAGMYLLTLVFALIDSPWALDCLKISFGLTILIPVLLWVYLAMFRLVSQKRQDNLDAAGQFHEKEQQEEP